MKAPPQVIVYKCVVCGASYTSNKALMGHMNKHRDIEWAHWSVRLPKEIVQRGKEVCRKHNATECHVTLMFLLALLKADEMGVPLNIGSPNTLFVQVVTPIAAKPRGHGKYDISKIDYDVADVKTCLFCNRPAMVLAQSSEKEGEDLPFCEAHFEELKFRGLISSWRKF